MLRARTRVWKATLRWLTIGMCNLAFQFAALDTSPGQAEEAAPATTAATNAPTFETDIVPILRSHCWKCHGEEVMEAGLDLRRRFTLLAGGDSGPAVVAGHPENSLLQKKLDAREMPPSDEPPLDDSQRELIRRWIEQGATLARPDEDALPAGTVVRRVTDQERNFWAFQAPVRPSVPQVNDTARVRTPIDAFLLARLEEAGLTFNPEAPREVQIRRLSYDLHGLPPTPEEVDAFLADTQPDAYERLVDRLLASPRYGERWGRHWLDVAGYADSDGYLAADRVRPEAWRYRDYVIRALNSDKPYDDFVREQIAGDELTDWRRAEFLTPEMIDDLVATGFLRTASDPTYPGYTEPNEMYQVLNDTVQIVSTGLLGLTLQCARCHAHKFDPFSQRDYYALQSVLLASFDPKRWEPSEVRGIPLASEAELARITEHNQKVDERVAYLNSALATLGQRHRKRWLLEKLPGLSSLASQDLDQLLAALATAADARSDDQKNLLARSAPGISLSDAELANLDPAYLAEAERIRAAIASETALKQQVPLVRGLRDLEADHDLARLLERGDYGKPGAAIAPDVPEVLARVGFHLQPKPGYKTSGRRAAFAEWLTDPAHPLVTRTQVNRMWSLHFGRGLVPTVANFGHSGVPPTHGELLDWLATELVQQGWRLKPLHRLMVTSTAYRQSSDLTQAQAEKDPEGTLYGSWRARRVEGEVLRDSVLFVAGKLEPRMFGPPVPVVLQSDGSVITDDSPLGNRRSIYLMVRRSQHLTLLDVFDTPAMEINCTQRNESIVPLQSLTMLHAQFAEASAAALAQRVVRDAPESTAAQIRLAFRLLYSREPGDRETASLLEFLDHVARETLADRADSASDADRQAAHLASWTQAALVMLNANEFVYIH